MKIIAPRSGTSFELLKGEKLKIIDIKGEQVSDFFCFMKDDLEDYLSSGRTHDYLSKITIENGDLLYSSKSKVMARILEDTVGVHDFILTPCSKETFEFQNQPPHRGCEGNLIEAFNRFGINYSSIPVTFNIFMNVKIFESNKIEVIAPVSKAGDYIIIEAIADLIVGLTACSAPKSNNWSFSTIGFEIENSLGENLTFNEKEYR